MSSIELSQIQHAFQEHLIFKQLSVRFEANKVTAIMGKSGCGKSTLLKCINGLVRPKSGEIKIAGQPVSDNWQQTRLKMGFAVQSVSLFPHLSIFDNISLLARLAAWPEDKIDARVEQLMQMVYLDEALKQRYPQQLSGGQKQRAALCRAMMLDPPILLLDEAFAAVDAWTKAEIHELLLDLLQKQPRTTIIVTHDIHEALLLSDTLHVLDDGIIAKTHRSTELREKFPTSQTPSLDALISEL